MHHGCEESEEMMFYQQGINLKYDSDYQDEIGSQVDKMTWLHYENPSQSEMHEVLNRYQLPVHFGEYVYDQFESSWIEYYRHEDGKLYTYIIIQYPYAQDDFEGHSYRTAPLVIVMGNDLVLTFMTHTNMPFIKRVQQGLIPSDFLMNSTYAFVMYLFYELAQVYIEAASHIHELIQESEKEARHSTKNNVSFRLINVNKGLIFLNTAAKNNGKTLTKINRFFETSEKDTHQHERILNRVQIEMNQAETMIHNNLALVEKLNDMLSNVISNNLNDVMKRLTVITIVMTVPTITAGLWGMNVALPFENNNHGFSIVLFGTVILSAIIYYLLDKFNLFK